MERHFTWNKGIFDNNYQIYENGQIKSSMFFDTWRSEAKAITPQKTYLFKDDGLYATTTKIFGDNHEVIGYIVYNDWKTKAAITLNSGETFNCDFINAWHSKWIITDFKGKQINYDSSSSAGNATANTDDELMLLIGFYVREHFTKMLLLLIFIIIFIPIITRGVF